MANDGRRFVFSDRHAYLQAAQFYCDQAELHRIDWAILQARNFERDSDDMERFEPYQAEALVHQHMPAESLMGIGCYDVAVKKELDVRVTQRDMRLRIVAKPSWFFR
jgi:hypothetical protein